MITSDRPFRHKRPDHSALYFLVAVLLLGAACIMTIRCRYDMRMAGDSWERRVGR
jgi:hypothetical protein